MASFKTVIFFLIPFVAPLVWSSFDCQTNSDCKVGECCSKIPRILAVSKRQSVDIPENLPPDWIVSSSCKPYNKENTSCAYVMTINGDCGCEPLTHCKYFPELNIMPTPPHKRGMVFGNPNAYLCTRN